MTQDRNRVAPGRRLADWLAAAFAGALMSAAFLLATSYLDGSGRVAPWSENFSLAFASTNALPGLLLMLLLWAGTGRLVISFLLAFAAYAAILATNHLKLAHLQTPLMPQDIEFLLNAPLSSLELFSKYVPVRWLLLAVVLAMVSVAATWRLLGSLPLRPAPRGLRVLVGGAALAITVALASPGGAGRSIYGPERSAVMSFDGVIAEKFPGVINNLVTPYRRHEDFLREGSPKAAAQLLSVGRGDPGRPPACRGAADAPPPDIVIVQSEAFFDAARLEGLQGVEVTPRFRTFLGSSSHGQLHVPTLGGNTIRTEYEVLTGQPLWVDPSVVYPYFELGVLDIPSLVSVLERHSYETTSVHANSGAFWRRSDVFRELGFDRQVWVEDFARIDRADFHIPDAFMTDEILRALDAPSDRPRFVFAIGIENHGPYEYHPSNYHATHEAMEGPPIALPESLPATERAKLATYLFHLRRVDRELGRLVDALEQRGRPALVVFFGDHLPALPTVFDALGTVDDLPKDRQPTSWLVVDLREDAPEPERSDIASWQLGAKVLQQAGLCDPYFAAIGDETAGRLAPLTNAAERNPQAADAELAGLKLAMQEFALLQRSGRACDAYRAAGQVPEYALECRAGTVADAGARDPSARDPDPGTSQDGANR